MLAPARGTQHPLRLPVMHKSVCNHFTYPPPRQRRQAQMRGEGGLGWGSWGLQVPSAQLCAQLSGATAQRRSKSRARLTQAPGLPAHSLDPLLNENMQHSSNTEALA